MSSARSGSRGSMKAHAVRHGGGSRLPAGARPRPNRQIDVRAGHTRGSAARPRPGRRGSRPAPGRWPRPAAAVSSAVRCRPAAPRLSSSCSMVRAPRITEVTAGRSCSQASATAAIDTRGPRPPPAPRRPRPRSARSRRAGRRPPRRARGPRRAGWPRSAARRAVYLPVSQPPPSGDQGSRPSPLACAGRDDLPLDLAGQQVVLRLQRHRARQAPVLGHVDRLLHLPAGEVGQPGVADLAGPHRVVEEAAASPRSGSAGPRRAPGRGRRTRPAAGAARRPAPGSVPAGQPDVVGSSPIGNRPLVASTTRSATPPAGRPASGR